MKDIEKKQIEGLLDSAREWIAVSLGGYNKSRLPLSCLALAEYKIQTAETLLHEVTKPN
jgi:hypothetical protein